jgi:chromate transporter
MTTISTTPQAPAPTTPPSSITFFEALKFWLKLGFISFGGPAGQIAIMQRELVDQKRWISQGRFNHALNYCMLLPGPEAQQLATYIGWLMHRTWGGVVAGALFVLPSLFILIALSWLYVRFGQVPAVAALFYGIKCAVAAIVVHAVWRVGSKTLKNPRKAPVLWAVAAMSFIAIEFFDVPFPWIVATAALIGWWGARMVPGQFAKGAGHGAASASTHAKAIIDDDTPTPAHARFARGRLAWVVVIGLALWALPMLAIVLWQGAQGTLAQMGWFFTKAALMTFGGAYAVLPYVVQGAVEQHQWLSAAQMMDGLALGETTPGPLIMVVAFVGFLGGWAKAVLGANALFASAALAATVVTWFTFLPSFIFILAGGPLVESTHGNVKLTAPLAAITAAVVGVIASLAVLFIANIAIKAGVLGDMLSRIDFAAVLIAATAGVALFRYKAGVISVIAACAAAGWVVRTLIL